MRLTLSDNIRSCRKTMGFTQEQLAEAMNVTVGAVSKWESGATTPELSVLLELAALFEVSVDALLGYHVLDSQSEQAVESIRDLMQGKKYDQAVHEAKKALLKYPNRFEMVWCAAELYQTIGCEKREPAATRKAQELLKHSLCLLVQNKDEAVDEAVVRNQLAQTWADLGKPERAAEEYKKYNYAGLNNSSIGFLLTLCGRYEEAGTYLSSAAVNHLSGLIRVVIGMAECAAHEGNLSQAQELLSWMRSILSGLRIPGKVSYLDRAEVILLSRQARYSNAAGDMAAAEGYLRRAADLARRFDASPEYGMENIRFCHTAKPVLVYDSFGRTAFQGLEDSLLHGGEPDSSSLQELWRKIKDEP